MENKLKSDIKNKIIEWDNLIKSGKISDVRTELSALKNLKFPRSIVCDICQIAKRTQMNLLTLKWLRPFVREFDVFLPNSTSTERALYASALMRIGAYFEADLILKNSSEKNDVQILLAKAHLEIYQWNYARSIPILKQYLHQIDPNSYAYLVGQLNLAAGYVAELDWANAHPLVEKIMQKCIDNKHWLIYGNSLELFAQIAIHNKNFALGKERLESAKQVISGSDNNYNFFIKKWEFIIDAMSNPYAGSIKNQFENIRAEAIKQNDWETLRELDFFYSVATSNQELFLKVYFGTRFKGYHRRMKKITNGQFTIPNLYLKRSDHLSIGSIKMIDLRTGLTNSAHLNLSDQPLLLRTFQTLMKDSYSPFHVGQMMENLYPGEYFDTMTSPMRIFKAVQRLRNWFIENDFPIDIINTNNSYAVQTVGPVAIMFSQKTKFSKIKNLNLVTFLLDWPKTFFSSKDLRNKLGLSERTSQRILREALDKNSLIKVNDGKNIYYRVA